MMFSASKMSITPEATGNSGRRPRCASCSIGRSPNRAESAQFATTSSGNTAIVPDHKHPKGMGGAWRDDHPDNIQATHWWCNGEKGRANLTNDECSVHQP